MAADLTVDHVLGALRDAGFISDADVSAARVREAIERARLQKERARAGLRFAAHVSPIESLAAMNLRDATGEALTEDRITEAVAHAVELPYKKIDPLKLDMKLITSTLSRPFAKRHVVLPLADANGTLDVAIANPFDRELLESLARTTRKTIRAVLSAKTDILRVITEIYGFRHSLRAAEAEIAGGPDLGNLEQLVRLTSVDEIEGTDKHVVAAVEYLFHYAFEQRASDIHIEPKRESGAIRLRIDGALHNVYQIPKKVHPAMVSRLKTIARLDIAEKRKPQDGRIKTTTGAREVEMRVSTMPVAFGEKVVIRIFDPVTLTQGLSDLGLFDREEKLLDSFLARPHGLILVTGPTGSGKTTTLYSCLKLLAKPDVNVVSIEDPIEMVTPDFNQVAVQPKAGVTFATALRTVLRQDPDIIMVGEIRDAETAELAAEAALTGHLVFSTLHTNDTTSTVTRLLELGLPPYLIASALTGVVAQRLVRTICSACKRERVLGVDEIAVLGLPRNESSAGNARSLRVWEGDGCPRCRETGYYGRSGVFEVLELNDNLRKLVHARTDAKALFRAARMDGLVTLREAAVRKLAIGATTVEEVISATGDLTE